MSQPQIGYQDVQVGGGSFITVPSTWTRRQALVWAREQGVLNLTPAGTRTDAREGRGAPIDQPNAWESFGAGGADVLGGAQQVTGSTLGAGLVGLPDLASTPEAAEEHRKGLATYEQSRGGGFDPFRLAGNVAATAPLGIPSMLAGPALSLTAKALQAGLGGAEGAAAGGLLFADTPQERANNMVLGGVGGTGAGVVGPWLGRAGAGLVRGTRRAGNAMRAMARPRDITVDIQQAGNRLRLDPEQVTEGLRDAYAQQAQRAMRTGGDVNPEMALRRAQMARQGFEGDAAPMLGQLNRDTGDWSDMMEAVRQRHSPEMVGRMDSQDAQIARRMDEIREQHAGTALTGDVTYEAGEAIEGAVQAEAGRMQGEVSQLYRIARENRPDLGIGPKALGVRLAPVRRDFKNVLERELGDMTRRIKELGKQEVVTAADLEDLDELGSMLYNPTAGRSPANTAIMRVKETIRGLQTAMGDQYGGEWQAAVRAAANRFQAIGGPRGPVFQFWRGAKDPAKLTQVLTNGPPREIERLATFVAERDPGAWSLARTAVWNDIVERSHPGGNFSQGAFNRTVQRMTPTRLRLIFGQDGANDIREFAQVVRDLMGPTARNSVNWSNTAGTLGRMMATLGRTLSGLPGMDAVLSVAQSAGEGAARRQTARVQLNPSITAPLVDGPGTQLVQDLISAAASPTVASMGAARSAQSE